MPKKKFNLADLASQVGPTATFIANLADTFSGKSVTQLETLTIAINAVFQAKKIPLRISVWKE